METRPPSRQKVSIAETVSLSDATTDTFGFSSECFNGMRSCIENIETKLNELPHLDREHISKIDLLLSKREELEVSRENHCQLRDEKSKEITHLKMKRETIQYEIDHLIKSRMRNAQSADLGEAVTTLREDILKLKLRLSIGMNELILRTNGEFV